MNKSMKRIIAFSVLALAFNLTACGTDDNSSTSSSQSPTSSDESTTSSSSEEVLTHLVTFNTNGGSSVESQRVRDGDKATKPEDPTKNGYNFVDWVDENDDHWVFNGYSITKDVTLYALWSDPIEYNVRFLNDDKEELFTTTAHYGDRVIYPYDDPEPNITESHYIYTFVGWDKSLTITGNTTLTAQYKKDYVVTTAYYHDYDNTLLDTVELAEGQTPHYTKETPTRDDDEDLQLQYAFKEWELIGETSDTVTFRAKYSECTRGIDFDGEEASFYHGSSKVVTVPSYWNGHIITTVGDLSFQGTSIEEVTIEEGITVIGNSAFSQCESLKTVNIPNTVLTIGGAAFKGCTALETITIPEGVKTIYSGAFRECTSLETISIPDSVTELSSYAFYSCTNLKSATIGSGINYIAHSLFDQCYSLESFVTPETIVEIQSSAFEYCTSLSSITLNEGLEEIDYRGFYECNSIKHIVIPSTVTTMAEDVFTEQEVMVVSYNNYRPKGWDLNWHRYPESVIWGFDGTIDSTDGFEYAVADGKAVLLSIDTTLNTITIPTTIGGYNVSKVVINAIYFSKAYKEKTLVRVNVPLSVEVDGSFDMLSFNGFSSLNNFTIPDGTTSIHEYCFKGCTSMVYVVIPESVTTISYSVFYNNGISKVYYKGTPSEWSSISINSGNTPLNSASRYYYSEEAIYDGQHWHYVGNTPTVWSY